MQNARTQTNAKCQNANECKMPNVMALEVAVGEYDGGREIRERSFRFAVRVVRLCQYLDERPGVGRTLGRQLIRSGTSVGANLEEAKAGHSRADFVAKCSISLKEARETHYWLRLVAETELVAKDRLVPMLAECDEITRVLGAIIVATRSHTR